MYAILILLNFFFMKKIILGLNKVHDVVIMIKKV